ncbi:hypothetical protein FNL39_103449 [Nocardia caishijiensis]|uniref:Uncharacterized protein n=2 Tax=Nocardia caishijiensis TaxID=184756 RepID=A0ABQ6YP92_9NOCA|nr:hypothetical protein FNL39_103449 [Nocardia caishijiensis]
MINLATTRRAVGDLAGACAAAHVDVDIDLGALARGHGRELVARVHDDLRHLAPDLLRWHLPRVAPDGLLRPGLTMTLARYPSESPGAGQGFVHLVVRTAPAWADAGQRVSLAVWDGGTGATHSHPHPRPNRRYRLDLHRHLWDARRAGELARRCGGLSTLIGPSAATEFVAGETAESFADPVPAHCAVERWAEEAALLLSAERGTSHTDAALVAVRLGARRQRVIEVVRQPPASSPGAVPPGQGRTPAPRFVADYPRGALTALPILPDAATWTLPDLELLRAGAITVDRLHPLVAESLAPDGTRPLTRSGNAPRQAHIVECRGEVHRIGVVNGVLSALDHDPAEIRREELLVALTGVALPCLRVIDEAHRRPDWISGVRERLDHGDTEGALAVVEGLLGTGAELRDGPLRDALAAAADRRVTYGRYRSETATHDAPRHVADRLRRAGLRYGHDRKLLQRLARHENRRRVVS